MGKERVTRLLRLDRAQALVVERVLHDRVRIRGAARVNAQWLWEVGRLYAGKHGTVSDRAVSRSDDRTQRSPHVHESLLEVQHVRLLRLPSRRLRLFPQNGRELGGAHAAQVSTNHTLPRRLHGTRSYLGRQT